MTTFGDVGAVPATYMHSGHDGDRSYMGLWIFALVLIFLGLIFLWGRRDGYDGRRDNGTDNILPYMAMLEAGKNRGNDYAQWDCCRDNMREFGEIKKEIMATSWTQQREQDRYHYDQRAAIDRNNYDTLLGFKNNEILGLQNTGRIETRIDGLERRLDQDIIRKQGEELNYLKTVAALAPRPPVPAYFPRFDMPIQHNMFAYEPACYPSGC